MQNKTGTLTAIGLMTGTSADGVDVALLETDGDAIVRPGPGLAIPFTDVERQAAKTAIARGVELNRRADDPIISEAERTLTLANARGVQQLIEDHDLDAAAIDLIGFHGQTILHAPNRRLTWQIGDAELLARETGISVISDFRAADVAAAGQGAPFAPAYHMALARNAGMELPVVFLNIGGISNVTWIGPDGILAFDAGMGNGLIDDWISSTLGAPFDDGGKLAASGRIIEGVAASFLDNRWFDKPPPKSLDRHDFTLQAVDGLDPADGAATLTAITARSITLAWQHFPARPKAVLVCGGGRHNPVIMNGLQADLGIPVMPVEEAGFRGDLLEAEAFAYLAVRSLKGRPLSWPSTTGVPEPTTGGVLIEA